MAMMIQSAHIPTEEEAQFSKESSRIFAAYVSSKVHQLKIVEDDGSEKIAKIPESAYRLFVDVLTQMAQRNAVTLIPIHAELTTQQAADLMNVSRPYLIKLMEAGEIAYCKVGRHRRVRFEDLMAYKTKVDASRQDALDELVVETELLGLYD